MNKFSSGAQSLAETTKYWLNTFWAAVHILLLLHLIYLNTFAVYLQNFGQSFSAMTKTSQGIISVLFKSLTPLNARHFFEV